MDNNKIIDNQDLSDIILQKYVERINFYLKNHSRGFTQHEIESAANLYKNDLVQMKVQPNINFRKAIQLANFFGISVFQLLPVNINGELVSTEDINIELQAKRKERLREACLKLIDELYI